MVRQRHQRGGAGAGPEIEQRSGGMPDGGAEQHRIEAGAKALCRLGQGQPAAQKGVVCDVAAFYNFAVVG